MPSRPSSLVPFSPFNASGSRRRLLRLAYHEAAHAVTALHLGQRVEHVSIVPRLYHGYRARTVCGLGSDGANILQEAERSILSLLAGPAAEERFAGAAAGDSARVDWTMAAEVALAVCSTEAGATAYLDRLWGRARAMVADPLVWATIEVLARVLLERRELRGQGGAADRAGGGRGGGGGTGQGLSLLPFHEATAESPMDQPARWSRAKDPSELGTSGGMACGPGHGSASILDQTL